jgi:hypothetical protein
MSEGTERMGVMCLRDKEPLGRPDMEHSFTSVIMRILNQSFAGKFQDVFDASPLLQYLNIKTRSASRGSKSRSAFGNHYALYVLVEDYVKHGFDKSGNYQEYEGAQFSQLFRRQRELPFGSKLQNHALNHRLNEEFRKYFPTCEYTPILRDVSTNRYWVNENLLRISIDGQVRNIAAVILQIIDAYIAAKQTAFDSFMDACKKLQALETSEPHQVREFIRSLVRPEIDARIFEIVSFSILKAYYSHSSIFWGWTRDDLQEDYLVLYKTGRVNANDGGIDFVMRPLGRFFQVTETLDVKKYFLDIDKIQRYPLTFVIKSQTAPEELLAAIRDQAIRLYRVKKVVERFVSCVEEIINIPILLERFEEAVGKSSLDHIMEEIIRQSRIEFNREEE